MRHQLAHQAMAAMAWSYVGVGAYIVLQVVANVAYARILGPEAFGLFAAGLLATGILRQISDLGLGSALTQAESLHEAQIRWAFGRLLLAGAVACLVLLIGSRPFASILKDARLVPVFRCFAVSLLCFPFVTVCGALLARKLDQKHTQLANVVGYGIGYCGIGLAAAIQGLGTWSPILGFFAQLLINIAVLFAYSRPNLRLSFTRAPREAGPMQQFGIRVMLTNVSNWLIYSMDNLLVQFYFGTLQFGLYSVAYSLVRTPADHLVQTIQNVLLPASSRIKEDHDRLARAYLAALEAVLIVMLPVFATVAVLAATFIACLYGPRWSGAGAVLAPLALAMPLQAVSTVTSALLWGGGHVGKELRVQWLVAPVLFLAIVIGAHMSFASVAWGVLLAYLIRATLMAWVFARLLNISLPRLTNACRGGTILALVIAPSMGLFDSWLGTHKKPLENLLFEFIAAGLSWLVLVVCGRKLLLSSDLSGLAMTARIHFLPRLLPKLYRAPR